MPIKQNTTKLSNEWLGYQLLFSVAVIKYHDKKKTNLRKKGFVLAHSSRGESTKAGKALHGDWSKRLADHIFVHTQEAERIKQEVNRANDS